MAKIMAIIEHDGKYCPACTENSIFPILPKCKEFETRQFCERINCWHPLELCPADYPFNPDFWICPKCESTYVYEKDK